MRLACRDLQGLMEHRVRMEQPAHREQQDLKVQRVLKGLQDLKELQGRQAHKEHRAHKVRPVLHRVLRAPKAAKGLRDSREQSRLSSPYRLSSAKSTLSFSVSRCRRFTSRIYSWSRRATREVTAM